MLIATDPETGHRAPIQHMDARRTLPPAAARIEKLLSDTTGTEGALALTRRALVEQLATAPHDKPALARQLTAYRKQLEAAFVASAAALNDVRTGR